MTRRAPLAPVLTLALLALVALAPASSGQDKKDADKRRAALEKAAKKLQVPLDALAAAGGERWVSADPAQRKAFLADLGARPAGALFPLVVEAAQREPDFEVRRAAVRLLSVVGLEADRAQYLAALPVFPRLFADRSDLVFCDAADELVTLERWMACDADVAPLLERTFEGENLNTAKRAFTALLQVDEPQLRRGLVTRAVRAVLDKKGRFGPTERKRAVLAVADLRDAVSPQALAQWLHDDGPIAVECAVVLGELGDASVLPALRRIDRTSSFLLRAPVYQARGKLGDALLVPELGAAIESDHLFMQLAILDGLTHVKDARIDAALARLAPTVKEDALRRGLALARLARGDAADLAILQPLVEGGSPDAMISDRALSIDAPAVAPLLRAIASNDAQGGRRGAAIDRLGEAAFADDATRALLVKLAAEGDPSALRLRASASLLQLAPPDGVGPITSAQGVAAVTSALIKLDVVSREDVTTTAGKARRFSGSPLIDVCERWTRAGSVQAAPLLAAWLDPPGAPAPPPSPTTPGGSVVRGPAAPATAQPPPVEHLAHPLVRRAVVHALGALTVALRGLPDAATPGSRSAREAERAVRALARALDDPASIVRASAVRALAHVSGVDPLPIGASVQLEGEVEVKVRAWLASRPR